MSQLDAPPAEILQLQLQLQLVRAPGNFNFVSFLVSLIISLWTQEYALKAVDVLARRTRLAFIDSKAAHGAAPRVVEIMAELLGWSKRRCRQELEEVRGRLDRNADVSGVMGST